MTTGTQRIADWNVVDHGIEASDYFQGHGIALTDYTHTATGIGDNPSEALDDALECLASQCIDVEDLERSIRKEYPDLDDPEKNEAASVSARYGEIDQDEEVDECGEFNHWYYVSVDVTMA